MITTTLNIVVLYGVICHYGNYYNDTSYEQVYYRG